MSNQKNYYVPMSDESFNDIKKHAIEIWDTYDDTYGYASGKIERIKDLENVEDNAMYIIAMFDSENQRKLFGMLKEETIKELNDERLPFYIFTNLYE